MVCSAEANCFDGTCPPASSLPARSATRVVAKPVALAWVRKGSADAEAVATLGGEKNGRLLLRFAVPIEDADRIVAAHLVLTRVHGQPPLSQGEGEGAVLRAERIVDPWDERLVSWGNQPRTFDIGLARVRAYGARLDRLRVDVKDIVRRWPRRDASDQGIAIVGDGAPSVDVALSTLAPDHVLGSKPAFGPELELYVSAPAAAPAAPAASAPPASASAAAPPPASPDRSQ